jgi:GAF domain-containing protein/PilZ domain-containing protein/Sel1 repeat-containing protein
MRRKLHLSAYVGLNPARHQSLSGTTDLCEIIDLSEDGIAIQTTSPLQLGCQESLFLDLPEADASIHTSGTVIWAHASGRAGIQFVDLQTESLHAIKKWLFVDALAGCAQDAEARVGGQRDPWSETESDHTSVLIGLDAVRKEVEALGPDLDAALHLIARRAQAFTRSSASAIGLTEGHDMICRATAGPNAPGVGARLRVGSGFSGECVRTGKLLRCDDSETDPRVDRESCRALGIRSMIAAPFRSQGAVAGLIEVFSPQQNHFHPDHELVVQRLTEVVCAAVLRAHAPEPAPRPASATTVDDEFPLETPADLPILQFSRFRNLLLMSVAMTVLLGLLWVTQPWWAQPWNESGRGNSAAVSPAPLEAASPAAGANKLETLQKLAAGGDPVAQFDVGVRYWTGDQVAQDYGQAVHWFSLAAGQNNVAAQAMLGNCYWAGRGVPADSMRAYFWSFLAQAGGDETSKSRVALLTSRLSAGQIARAQKEAKDWIAQHPGKPPSPAP